MSMTAASKGCIIGKKLLPSLYIQRPIAPNTEHIYHALLKGIPYEDNAPLKNYH